jgi:DNA-binding NtrC family response regulator
MIWERGESVAHMHQAAQHSRVPGLPQTLLPGGSVLVVDDEPGIRAALDANFARKGWRVASAGSVSEARHHLENDIFDLVVSDIRMPDGDGTEVLRCARRLSPEAPTILLTAFGSVPDAVASMRMGAGDYLIKPITWEQMESVAAKLLGTRPQKQKAEPETAGIVGRSPRLLQALIRGRAAATTDADILIEAESGTGKELLARFIHAAGGRAGKPFVTIHCGAIAGHLLESELFGRANGAQPGTIPGGQQARGGKFELAAGGTLLLEAIDQLPLHLQPRLLRSLQERAAGQSSETHSTSLDIRVIATTDISLAEAAGQGRFRSDLFYRLNVIPLTLPPLRERVEDIPLLAQAFAEQIAIKMLRPVPMLTPDFLHKLQQQLWPGNIRELGNFMRRVLSLHPEGIIDGVAFDLEAEQPSSARPAPSAPRSISAIAAGAPIRELERHHLETTLAMTLGNRTQAAEMLGISLRTMRNRIREYGLPPRRYA